MEGKYNLQTSENFENFLSALGVGLLLRKAATAVKPTVEVIINGDEYTIKTISSMKNTEIKFKLGVEFVEDRVDGKRVKTTINKEGDNKLVQVQSGDKEVTIIREFNGENLFVTATVNNITSVRTYKRV